MVDRSEGHVQPLRLIPRRTLLHGSALIAGGVAAGLTPPARTFAQATPVGTPVGTPGGTSVSVDAYQPIALSADELTTLKAIINRLIPADDLGPGAVDAGVHIYIDGALAGAYAGRLELYQQALPVFDTGAGGGGFAAASGDIQDQVLTSAEGATLEGLPDGFFATLLQHTREGYFGDPIHGGNIGYVGWDLVGFPGIKLLWSPEDQAIGTVVAPEHKSVVDFGGSAS